MMMIAEIEQRVLAESSDLLFLERSIRSLAQVVYLYISLDKLRTFIFPFFFFL